MLAVLLAATLPWVGWLGSAAGAGRGVRRSAVAPRVAGTLQAGVRGFVRPNLNMTTSVISSTVQEPRHATKAVRMSPWTAARAAWTSNSFHEFMSYMRAHQGDILEVDLWPVLPPIYLVMGKAANRAVLSDLDSALEQVPCGCARVVALGVPPTLATRAALPQVLQDLINVLPVSAKIPSEVDVELQRKVASFFQKESTVNGQLPRFISAARTMREGWLAKPESSATLDVFFELSEYVLLTDLEVLYGKSFCDKYGARVIPGFRQWVENIANGELVATAHAASTRPPCGPPARARSDVAVPPLFGRWASSRSSATVCARPSPSSSRTPSGTRTSAR